MKYMGSKRALLGSGLGELLLERVAKAERFVDLFSGGCSVAWFVAQHAEVPVYAVDLQLYSKILAEAVLHRTEPRDGVAQHTDWLETAAKEAASSPLAAIAAASSKMPLDRTAIITARTRCSSMEKAGPVWRGYGGHYFSPTQALAFDSLLATLPEEPTDRALCHAAVIWAATRCAASPGHTAQPFQPTPNALPYIKDAWSKDPIQVSEGALATISRTHAKVRGQAEVADSNATAKHLRSTDLVFVDPPYSNVQYSRFYHVLEAIARQDVGEVEGVGRYPPLEDRPSSQYSRRSGASDAIADLLCTLARIGCEVVLTFPQFTASNGLSGENIAKSARKYFVVDVRSVMSRQSTLGGNGKTRSARKNTSELVVSMKPRLRSKTSHGQA